MIRYRKSMRDALGEVRGLIEDATTSYPPKEINKKKHDAYKDPKKGEKDIVESDPTIDDIAKGLKLDKKLVKKIMGEEVLDEGIPSRLMTDLKKTFEPLRGKKISVDNSNQLSAIMNKFTNKDELITLFKADIPFITQLAATRLIQKFGMSGAQINKLREEVELKEFSSQQIKQAYGIANDPRYKQGNMSGAVSAIEKIAKGLSKHPDVQKVLKRTQEEVELDEGKMSQIASYIDDIANAMSKDQMMKPFIAKFKADARKTLNPAKSLEDILPDYVPGSNIAKLLNMSEETIKEGSLEDVTQRLRAKKIGVKTISRTKDKVTHLYVHVNDVEDAQQIVKNDPLYIAGKLRVVAKEEVEINEEVADIHVKDKVGSQHQVQIALTIKRLANKLGLRNGSVGPVVRVMGPKNVVNQFLGSVIGKSSMGNATQKGTIPKDYDKSLNKQLREEKLELGEGTMKGGLITDKVDEILKIGPKFVALISRRPTVQQLERMCVQELFDDSLLDDFYYIDPSSKGIVKSGNPEAKKAYGKHASVLHRVDPRSILQYNLAGRTFQGRPDGLMLHSLGAAMLAFHLADLGIPAIKINPDLELVDNPNYKGTQKISPDVILKNFRVSKSDVLRVIQMHMRDMTQPEKSKLVSISPKSLQYQFKENLEHPGARKLVEKIAGLQKKAEKSGMPYGILKKVFDRGMAAWKGGHRPGASQHQWAFARVNSFITKSSGTWGGADKDLAAKVRSKK
jgi:hypothetical protein